MFLAGLLGVAGCGAERHDRPIDVTGSCYEFSGWDTVEVNEWALPALAMLSPRASVRDTAAFALIAESQTFSRRYMYWREVPPDSVEIVVSTGFSGAVLRLSVGADTLSGTVEEIYDAGDGATGPAAAIRVPCGTRFEGR